MIREKNTGQHNIHDRSVIGYDNIGLRLINFFTSFRNHFVSETHSVEHPDSPETDKKIAEFVILLPDR
jgi:hypothetical protein